jgi:hypothetical protein
MRRGLQTARMKAEAPGSRRRHLEQAACDRQVLENVGRLVLVGEVVVEEDRGSNGEGYEVQVVTDASASFTKVGDDAARRRIEQAGAVTTSTAQIISELAVDWTTPRGQALGKLMGLGG